MICYDVTNKQAFDTLKNWIDQSSEFLKNFPSVLVESHPDESKERQVEKAYALQVYTLLRIWRSALYWLVQWSTASGMDLHGIEKLSSHIEQALSTLMYKISRHLEEDTLETSSNGRKKKRNPYKVVRFLLARLNVVRK